MYERRGTRPIPRGRFLRRLAAHFGAASIVVFASLAGGMAGYAYFEGLSCLDSFLNASMILGGMGPVENLKTPGGKMFAGLYALYSGLVFLVVMSIVLAPMVHRMLHEFHWDEKESREGRAK
jgi:hypothetical protein